MTHHFMLTSQRYNSFQWMVEQIKCSTGRSSIQQWKIKDKVCTNFGVTKLLSYAQSDLKSITSFMPTPLITLIHHCCHREYAIHTSFLYSQMFETACKMGFQNWCYLSVPAGIPGQLTVFFKQKNSHHLFRSRVGNVYLCWTVKQAEWHWRT